MTDKKKKEDDFTGMQLTGLIATIVLVVGCIGGLIWASEALQVHVSGYANYKNIYEKSGEVGIVTESGWRLPTTKIHGYRSSVIKDYDIVQFADGTNVMMVFDFYYDIPKYDTDLLKLHATYGSPEGLKKALRFYIRALTKKTFGQLTFDKVHSDTSYCQSGEVVHNVETNYTVQLTKEIENDWLIRSGKLLIRIEIPQPPKEPLHPEIKKNGQDLDKAIAMLNDERSYQISKSFQRNDILQKYNMKYRN